MSDQLFNDQAFAQIKGQMGFDQIPESLRGNASDAIARHVKEGDDPALIRYYRVPSGLYRTISAEGTSRPIGFES